MHDNYLKNSLNRDKLFHGFGICCPEMYVQVLYHTKKKQSKKSNSIDLFFIKKDTFSITTSGRNLGVARGRNSLVSDLNNGGNETNHIEIPFTTSAGESLINNTITCNNINSANNTQSSAETSFNARDRLNQEGGVREQTILDDENRYLLQVRLIINDNSYLSGLQPILVE